MKVIYKNSELLLKDKANLPYILANNFYLHNKTDKINELTSMLVNLNNEGLLEKFSTMLPFLGNTKDELGMDVVSQNNRIEFTDNIQFGNNYIFSTTYNLDEKGEHEVILTSDKPPYSIFSVSNFMDTSASYFGTAPYISARNNGMGATIGGVSLTSEFPHKKTYSMFLTVDNERKLNYNINNTLYKSEDSSYAYIQRSNIIGWLPGDGYTSQYLFKGNVYFHATANLNYEEASIAKTIIDEFIKCKEIVI